MLDFKNINEFLNVTYKIHANGELISSQHLIIDSLNPKEEKWFDLNVPNIPNGICTILFEYNVKQDESLYKKDMNLGHDQFIINEGNNLSYINDLYYI